MNSLFNPDNPIFHFLSRIADIIFLNLLFLLCCIPIITVGPSISALYYCMLKIIRNRDSSITGKFFQSFRENLKQGSLLSIIFLLATLFLVVDIKICNAMEGAMLNYVQIPLYLFCIILIVTVSYVFPLLAQFENTNINLIKNAFMLSISNFGYTAVIVAFHAIPFLLFFYLPELFILNFPIFLSVGFSLIAMINSKMFVKIFDRFIPDDQK